MEFLLNIFKKIKIKQFFYALIILIVIWTVSKNLTPYLNSSTSVEYVSEKTDKIKSQMITVNLNELFSIGNCLLNEAGKRIVDIRKNTKNSEFDQKKADKSVVTNADLESHNIIVHTLNYKYRSLNIISEESTAKDSDIEAQNYLKKCDNYEKKSTDIYFNLRDINVWVDPLDATQEYSGLFDLFIY